MLSSCNLANMEQAIVHAAVFQELVCRALQLTLSGRQAVDTEINGK